MSALIPTNLTAALHLHALGVPVEVETSHGPLLLQSWESGRLHRVLAGHPDRRIGVPEWAVPDFNVIRGYCDDCARRRRRRWCSHAWPTPILPPEMRRINADGADSADGNLHTSSPSRQQGASCFEMVERLAVMGCRPTVRGAFKWRALCPICRMRGKLDRRVYVERDPETGRDRLSTFCHCDRRDILAVLGLGWTRLQ